MSPVRHRPRRPGAERRSDRGRCRGARSRSGVTEPPVFEGHDSSNGLSPSPAASRDHHHSANALIHGSRLVSAHGSSGARPGRRTRAGTCAYSSRMRRAPPITGPQKYRVAAIHHACFRPRRCLRPGERSTASASPRRGSGCSPSVSPAPFRRRQMGRAGGPHRRLLPMHRRDSAPLQAGPAFGDKRVSDQAPDACFHDRMLHRPHARFAKPPPRERPGRNGWRRVRRPFYRAPPPGSPPAPPRCCAHRRQAREQAERPTGATRVEESSAALNGAVIS